MKDVFLDTVGLIAVWDATDQWNTAADAAYQKLLKQGRRLLTTPLIL
jgi:predicted nucleic acid-binding protein